MKYFGILMVLGLVFGCESEESKIYRLPENVAEMVAGNDSKIWKLARRYNDGTRMNMGYCFLLHRETYWADGSFQNNSDDNPGCGPSLLAKWKITHDSVGNSFIRLTGDLIPELMGVDEPYKFFKLLKLTEEEMVLEYRHRQFSDKWRTIRDIWVREDIDVENRDFHW